MHHITMFNNHNSNGKDENELNTTNKPKYNNDHWCYKKKEKRIKNIYENYESKIKHNHTIITIIK